MIWQYLIGASPKQILCLPDIHPDKTVDDYDISKAERALIGFWLSKGSVIPKKSLGGWAKSRPECGGWGVNIRERLAHQVNFIRGWRVVLGDYHKANLGSGGCYHIDPPYKKAGIHYTRGSDEICYESLAEWCRGLSGPAHVCESSGADWLPFKPFKKTKASTREGARFSYEVLWCNQYASQPTLFPNEM